MSKAYGVLNLPRSVPDRPKAELPVGMTAQELEKDGAKRMIGPGFLRMLCITPAQFAALPDGTHLQTLHLEPGMRSAIFVKGQDDISIDGRGGIIAYGFEIPDDKPAEVASRVNTIAGQTTDDIGERVISA